MYGVFRFSHLTSGYSTVIHFGKEYVSAAKNTLNSYDNINSVWNMFNVGTCK